MASNGDIWGNCRGRGGSESEMDKGRRNDMTFKERVEGSPVFYLLTALLTGFLGGLATYEAILRIARLDTVRQGTYVSQEEVARGYVRRSDIKESSRGDAEASPNSEVLDTEGNAAARDERALPVSTKPAPPPPFPRIAETEEYLFELSACTLSGDEVRCDLLVTAKSRDRLLTFWGTSRLVENDGSELFASQIWLGNKYNQGGDTTKSKRS